MTERHELDIYLDKLTPEERYDVMSKFYKLLECRGGFGGLRYEATISKCLDDIADTFRLNGVEIEQYT
jgi:hypothetical protein